MGWFDEQIKQRKLNDDEILAATYSELAGVVLGHKIANALEDRGNIAKDAMGEVLKYYKIKSIEVPEEIKEVNEQLEYLMRPYGIMRRTVRLSKGWTGDATGAMLSTRSDDGTIVALIPNRISGYSFYDYKTGTRVKLNRRNEHLIDEEAMVFYRPFPLRKINLADLVLFAQNCISGIDVIYTLVTMAIMTFVGMLIPELNRRLFSEVIDSGQVRVLTAVAVFMICTLISRSLISSLSAIISSRINTKLDVAVSAATMMRVLSLPADFFKKYSSGELSKYTENINSLCDTIISSVLSTGLASVFSLIYILEIFVFTPKLVVPAVVITIVTTVFSVTTSIIESKRLKSMMMAQAKCSGTTYSLISGIQKIRLSGSHKRAFAKWGKEYSKQAQYEYDPPRIIKLNGAISTGISLVGAIILYYQAIISNVSVAEYYAFDAAYAMVSGAFMSLATIALTFARIKPVIEMAKPIMDAEPEISEGKQVITRVSGTIELNNISFKYAENMPYVLDNISLKIKSGQYVAIVGKTGCGKSTLMRLLLGFEKPQKGAIYYDNKDINSIDLKSLRRKIGVVLQNGKLFLGDIYSNIVISAPWLTVDDAWSAAEVAGLADDIRNMPMGMNTMISEGSGGISGGQKQRLMIARAVAPKPKILMFDEATSALDNITQKKVSDALEKLKCTRIVIAHRLSTIKHCDRIIVLDDGKIVEDGKYEELIANNGFFAELVSRQRVDEE